MRFEDKAAIVTGGGRNVGAAISSRLAREGARVAVVDMDTGRGESVAAELNEIRPGAGHFIRCDVASADDVRRMVDEVAATLGGVDILVNGVAITDRGTTVLDLEEEVWSRVLAVSLDSVFLCAKYAGRRMAGQGRGGAIVNIGSTSGHRGRRNATAYAAAKGAIIPLTRSLAMQLGEHGIRVNTVTPNKVGSPVGEDVEPADRKRDNLLGRGAVPDDIAAAVAFLCSAEAAFITAADLIVDGGSLYASTGG